jgi:hypothetical protein
LQAYRVFHTPSQSLLRQIAREYPDVRLVVPGDSLCRGERCIGEIGGEPLYRDHIHLRRNLSQHTKAILASRIGLDDLFSPPKN